MAGTVNGAFQGEVEADRPALPATESLVKGAVGGRQGPGGGNRTVNSREFGYLNVNEIGGRQRRVPVNEIVFRRIAQQPGNPFLLDTLEVQGAAKQFYR